MPLVTGNLSVQSRAAELLLAVLHHPQNVMRETSEVEKVPVPEGNMGWEEWDMLTAVAASLRESLAQGGQRPLDAEIHLLRHLAARHQPGLSQERVARQQVEQGA